ncbi:GAF domain-containing protein [Alkalihalobacillus sp. BA299]|uniref:GAF domain-containing protein n=1 Tax=Alkalihalobacillus sp. BA299 TaxID=2815938 RepID=UPI001ADB3537|nr:GAF domain-containing protein [Alkalihalobacillus sp. BA299]
METELLSELNIKTSSDFSGIALVAPIIHQIYWRSAIGSINDRYKEMRKMYGSGLVGAVVRHGRLIIIDNNDKDAAQKRLQSPIMLAERLYSAIAAPIFSEQEVIGVLLVGSRSNRTYFADDIQYVLAMTKEIASLLEIENKQKK